MNDTTNLHLRVVGNIVENHRLYSVPRLQAVKDLVLRAMAEFAPQNVSLRQIQSALCCGDIPLVSEHVLREALNSLQRSDRSIEIVEKGTRTYKLLISVPPNRNSFEDLFAGSWNRNFTGCSGASVAHFRQAVSLIFARFGCAAYESLTSRGTSLVRVDDVVGGLGLPREAEGHFREAFGEFILSTHPDDALLKYRLASTYVLLRMNGAGNWEHDDLRAYFSGKILLLDTNILFEIISSNIGQVTELFAKISDLGASLVIGTETRKEFEKAIRNAAENVVDLAKKGVDLARLVDEHVLRGEWIKALVEDSPRPTHEDVFNRVERLLLQVDGTLDACHVTFVQLQRSEVDEKTKARIERIQALALERRHFEKHEEVALHDALLWEAVEDEPRLADLVLTQDRALGRVRTDGGSMVILWDELLAYALMGGADEAALAGVLTHSLSQDLCPDVAFLRVEDVQSIARMEVNLLTGPPRALRAAASRLAALRTIRLASGAPISEDEVARVLIDSISTYRQDRVIADQERGARIAAEGEAAELRTRVENLDKKLRDGEASQHRLKEAETRLEAGLAERASLRADLTELSKRQLAVEGERSLKDEEARKRRDWMLYSAFLLAGALVAAIVGLLWAAAVLVAVAVGCLVWSALAQNTPKVSIKLLTVVASALAAAAGMAQKLPHLLATRPSVPTTVGETGIMLPVDGSRPLDPTSAERK